LNLAGSFLEPDGKEQGKKSSLEQRKGKSEPNISLLVCYIDIWKISSGFVHF
jgi:hypothetical protein